MYIDIYCCYYANCDPSTLLLLLLCSRARFPADDAGECPTSPDPGFVTWALTNIRF